MFFGGAVHPAYRNRILRMLATLDRVERHEPEMLTAQQRQQIQDARDFLRREQQTEMYAPYNRTIVHVRNLERIVNTIPRLGYEESKSF